MIRGALGFFVGIVIGTLAVVFIWGVTDCEYAPQYGITNNG
jgi:hypothetical protein